MRNYFSSINSHDYCMAQPEYGISNFRLFHVEHFIFESGRLIQALIGKDEEKEMLKSFMHGLLSIQAEAG
ncbi:MAG: hypothetical protein LBI95_03220 [Holosporales bacterium]|nr:hypothetical protein [Holosporales bacterium]